MRVLLIHIKLAGLALEQLLVKNQVRGIGGKKPRGKNLGGRGEENKLFHSLLTLILLLKVEEIISANQKKTHKEIAADVLKVRLVVENNLRINLVVTAETRTWRRRFL